MTFLSLLFAQAQSAPAAVLDVGQIAQTLTAAGVTGLIVFAFRFNDRMTRIETVLLEPDMGVVPRVKGIGRQGHDNAGRIQGHGLKLEEHERRLGEHDETLEELKKEGRSLQPSDVGKLDRRT